MIRIVIRKDLEEWWGADDALADGGEQGVIELCKEDVSALLEGATWDVVKLED